LLRGYALSTLWVVTVPSFIVAVDTLGASLYISIAQGLGMTVVGTLIALIAWYIYERKHGLEITPVLQKEINTILRNSSTKKIRIEKVREFFFLFLSLFGTIFIVYAIWQVPLMILIPLIIIFWMIAFYLIKRRVDQLHVITITYVHRVLLNQTSFAMNVVNGLNTVEHAVSWLNPLFLLPFIVMILGFFGLGPLTVMVLVAGILESMALPYPPELIVLAITSGSVLSILLSP